MTSMSDIPPEERGFKVGRPLYVGGGASYDLAGDDSELVEELRYYFGQVSLWPESQRANIAAARAADAIERLTVERDTARAELAEVKAIKGVTVDYEQQLQADLAAAVARTQTLEAALRDLADHAEQFGADELFLPVKNAWAALAAESEKP